MESQQKGHTMTSQNDAAKNNVITAVLQGILFDSADLQKVQAEIQKKFNITMSIDEIRATQSFYGLFNKIRTSRENTL